MLNDECKEIPGYEGIYWVSPDGKICNSRKWLKTYQINSGYTAIKLRNAIGIVKSFLLHRLVAQVFVPNPELKPFVNHIDGVKTNCSVGNLEWVTNSENILHARNTGLNPYNNPTAGLKIGKGSKYRNVSYDIQRKKWIASIRHEGKNLNMKRFDSEEDAAEHVNWIIDHHGLDRPKNII